MVGEKIQLKTKMNKMVTLSVKTQTDDWITEEQLRKAKIQAKPIFQDFLRDEEDDESDWTEIEIDGQYFDINCWEDDMKKPATETYCAIYPTHLINGLRQTDGQRYKRLFIGTRTDDLEKINIFERVEEEKKDAD